MTLSPGTRLGPYAIVAPLGDYLAGPLFGLEGILMADLDLAARADAFDFAMPVSRDRTGRRTITASKPTTLLPAICSQSRPRAKNDRASCQWVWSGRYSFCQSNRPFLPE